MSKFKTLFLISMAIFALTDIHPVWAASVFMQSEAGAATGPSDGQKLTEQERRGAGLFLQRCSVCHLSMKSKSKLTPSFGPPLAGVFKGASPAKEKALRELISKGTDKMPGFQYGLEPKELDDVIAYLKTI